MCVTSVESCMSFSEVRGTTYHLDGVMYITWVESCVSPGWSHVCHLSEVVCVTWVEPCMSHGWGYVCHLSAVMCVTWVQSCVSLECSHVRHLSEVVCVTWVESCMSYRLNQAQSGTSLSLSYSCTEQSVVYIHLKEFLFLSHIADHLFYFLSKLLLNIPRYWKMLLITLIYVFISKFTFQQCVYKET